MTWSVVELAAPRAVLITPSIPLAPRFPIKVSCLEEGFPKRSISRMGMLFDTMIVELVGVISKREEAIEPSKKESWESINAQ